MPPYEYMIERYKADPTAACNQLASEGWEPVAIAIAADTDDYAFLYRRKLEV